MNPDLRPLPRRAAQAALGALIALALNPASPLASEAAWTPERVLDAVRAHDPGIRAVRAAGTAGRAEAAQAWAMLAPHVTLSGGFTRTDDPAVLFSQKLWQGRFSAPDFAIDQLNQPAPQSALQIALAWDQPLWNGGREWTAPGLAAHGARAATAMERANVSTRLLAAIEAFAAAVKARDDARAAEQGLAAASAMRTSAAARFRMGQVAELDTLRASARESDARVRALGAKRSLVVTLDHLSRLVGSAIEPDALVPPAVVPAAGERAESRRGELQAMREGAAVAATQSRTAALQLLPSINSRVAVTHYRPWDSGSYERRWLVALSADLPLFDGAQRLNAWRAARAKADEARAMAEALERDLAVGLAAARVEAEVARERVDAARGGRAAADEAARLAELRYRAGLLPLTEWLAADAEASAARAAENEASTAVLLAHYRLLHAQGDLR